MRFDFMKNRMAVSAVFTAGFIIGIIICSIVN